MKKWLLMTGIFFCVSSVFGQKQFNGWLASNNTMNIGKYTSIHSDIQLRSTNKFGHIQTLILRAGLNVKVSKKITVTAGYAWVNNQRKAGNVTGYIAEHRLWQQILYSNKISRVFASHRLRFEERFLPKIVIENNELKKNGNRYAGRLRYFTRNVLPFKNYDRAFAKGAFASLQDEVFLNIGNKNAVNGKVFDQNRFLLALGYRFSHSFDLEAGYMNQYINGRADAFTNNHIVQLSMYLRL